MLLAELLDPIFQVMMRAVKCTKRARDKDLGDPKVIQRQSASGHCNAAHAAPAHNLPFNLNSDFCGCRKKLVQALAVAEQDNRGHKVKPWNDKPRNAALQAVLFHLAFQSCPFLHECILHEVKQRPAKCQQNPQLPETAFCWTKICTEAVLAEADGNDISRLAIKLSQQKRATSCPDHI